MFQTVIVLISIVLALSYPKLQEYYEVFEFGGKPEAFGRDSCKLQGKNLLQACEHISLHQKTGQVYLACDDPNERLLWWPPLTRFNETGKSSGKLFIYDPSTEDIKQLQLENFDGELYTHGMDIMEHPDRENVVMIALVNHRKDGSAIEFFDYTVGSDSAVHVETIRDLELLPRPNAVTIAGPTSFYATNDLKNKAGFWREYEIFLQRPTGHVVFRDGESKKMRIVAKDLTYANGIAMNNARDIVYVAEPTSRRIAVFLRKDNNSLRLGEKVDLKHLPDNLYVDRATDTLYAAGMTDPLNFSFKYKHDPLNNVQSGSIVKITYAPSGQPHIPNKFHVESVYGDDGTFASCITTTVVDSERKVSVISGIFNKDVTVCRKAL